MLLLRVPRDVPLSAFASSLSSCFSSEKNYMTARLVCMQFRKLGLGVKGGKETVSLNLGKKLLKIVGKLKALQ